MAPPRREVQLTDDELRQVRVILAERSYDDARSRFLSSAGKRARATAAAAMFALLFAVNCVELYYVSTQHHPAPVIVIQHDKVRP